MRLRQIFLLAPLLLLLLSVLLTPASALKLLRKKQHRTDPKASETQTAPRSQGTRPGSQASQQNVTIAQQGPNGILMNVTLPKECLPVTQQCLDEKLTPLVDIAHNETASARKKNTQLQSFCASECGQK